MDKDTEDVTCPEDAIPVVFGLSRFRNCEELSDYTIKCGQAEWPVHRLVLTLHSSVLARACLGDFRESRQGFIDLSGDPQECVEALIYYLYNFDYYTRVDEPGAEPKFHVAMAVIGDKYDISTLKKRAIKKCKHALHGNCNADIFAETVATIYDSAVALRELCDYVVEFAIDHKDVGVDKKICPSLANVMRIYPELGIDFTEKLASRPAMIKPPRELEVEGVRACPQCYKDCSLAIRERTAKHRCKHCHQEFYGSYWLLDRFSSAATSTRPGR